jgi:hypothetical protein
MRYLSWIAVAMICTGCVVDERSRADDPPVLDAQTDAGSADGGLDATSDPDGAEPEAPEPETGEPETGEPESPEPEPEGEPETGEPESPEPESPEPEPEDLCAQTCDHMRACFASDCEALAGADFLEELCFGLCDAPDNLQRRLLGQACPQYIESLEGFIPELEQLCSDEPPPDECAAICEFLPTCQAGIEPEDCALFCRTFEAEQLNCVANASDAQSCQQAFACFADEPPPGPEPEELCQDVCQRRNLCVQRECAPGTLQPGDGRACFQTCMQNPPSAEEARAEGMRRCADIVDELRQDAAFAMRCAADDQQACAQLCDDVVGECVDREMCLAACPGWNDTNLTCLRFAGGRCGVVQTCIAGGEGQQLCEQSCARWSECLGQACPPRILPPNLESNCAAGCLFDPPSAEEAAAYQALACVDVRAEVYIDNPELAPICEGDPEFNPTAEECVGFCERGLAECIGIGGQDFCLGACATLEREEYECALAAGADCDAINACLAD